MPGLIIDGSEGDRGEKETSSHMGISKGGTWQPRDVQHLCNFTFSKAPAAPTAATNITAPGPNCDISLQPLAPFPHSRRSHRHQPKTREEDGKGGVQGRHKRRSYIRRVASDARTWGLEKPRKGRVRGRLRLGSEGLSGIT